MNRINYGMVLLILNVSFIAGCSTAKPTAQNSTNKKINQQDSAAANQEIRELVKKFSEDQGPLGEDALRKLQAYPQAELTETLVELEQTLRAGDKLRPQIAFVSCWLNRDYDSNVKIIEAGLSKSPPYQGFYADDSQMMLSRLIQHGKTDLLKPLFESVPWADGSVAEGLAETFTRELNNDPEQFLSKLSPYPAKTREDVFFLITSADSLTDTELAKLRKDLSSIPKTSPAYKPAKELLRSLRAKSSK